ncbi:EamA family transporter RarD [Paraburkholderia youngii]|uniref:EamA family transporter RarD n=1 Tax=Paraburkholderia youngii TaxID=2782701 RepID=UPI003D1D7E95
MPLCPLSGMVIFSWRLIWTAPAAVILLLLSGRLHALRDLAQRGLKHPMLGVAMLINTTLLGVQLWVFMWAPLHGRMLEISLGYFLLPLAMVLVGRFYYHERLDCMQWTAVGCAAIGVAHELWSTGAFSWPTALIVLSYPPYFVLRRKIDADALTSFAAEVLILLPVAIWQVLDHRGLTAVSGNIKLLVVLLPGLGALSTAAVASYLMAGRILPMSLFGLLGYVEPVLLLFVSLGLLGESFTQQKLATYAPIWLAVGLIGIHGALHMRSPKR